MVDEDAFTTDNFLSDQAYETDDLLLVESELV